MAATITLADNGNSVTVKAPSKPYGYDYRNRQKIGYAPGGSIQVADWGSDDQIVILHFVRLSKTDHDNLRTFVVTTINWAKTVITYTDADAVDHTNMRCISPEWAFREMPRAHELFEGTLILRKDL